MKITGLTSVLKRANHFSIFFFFFCQFQFAVLDLIPLNLDLL